MKVRVLGDVQAEVEGTLVGLGGPKQRAVLGMLAASAGRSVSIDQLIDGVWGEHPPAAVRTSVHSYVSNLRSALGGGIDRSGSAYRLEIEPDDIDAVEFESLLDQGRRIKQRSPSRAASTLRRGLALWRGRPYADLPDVAGLQLEARRLDELRLTAIEERIGADLDLGRHRRVIGELETLTEEHPYRESLRAQHVLALYRDGRQAEALRAFQRTREILHDELGVDPTPELLELEQRILNHDPLLLGDRDADRAQVALLASDVTVPATAWDDDPHETETMLVRYDKTLTAAIAASGGRVFRREGNLVLAAFPDVSTAARTAVSVQRSFVEGAGDSAPSSPVRIAVDAGTADAVGDDLVGATVTRAMRTVAVAHPGQILISDAAEAGLHRKSGVDLVDLGEQRLAGLADALHTFQVTAPGLPEAFPGLDSDTAPGFTSGDAIRSYELREQIGAGAFGIVYRAFQRSVGREVALKVIRRELANSPEFVRRFETEARVVARLNHPHIVPLFDFWRDHKGAYLVMPYLSGGSLAAQLGEPMPAQDVIPVLTQLGSALAFAHSRNVVHGDVKPSNVLRDGQGNVFLADFGLALRRAPSRRSTATEADLAADVRELASLGVRLLTGRGPDEGGWEAIPDPLGDVLRRAVDVRHEATPPAAGELVDALESIGATPGLSPAAATRNPYKGLAAYDTTDAADFHGRESEIATLLQLMGRHRLVTVVGPSGSGKSSLVRAGVLPALSADLIAGSGTWLSATFLPGRHPFERLAEALRTLAVEDLGDLVGDLRSGRADLDATIARLLRDDATEFLLVVDQFEELYTRCDDDERRQFIDAIVAATTDPASRIRVLAAIRADFFDRPLADDALAGLVSEIHLAIGVPPSAKLREIIVRPAAEANVRLEPGLAEQIVADVRGQPGALPLMQFVLSELVEAAGGGEITVAAYRDLGGVQGAIGRRADEILAALSPAHRRAAEQVFLRLVTVGDDGTATRRRARLSELHTLGHSRAAIDAALEAFGSARLLTFDNDPTSRSPTVEVAHEALLREWPTLAAQVAEQHGALVTHRRLAQLVHAWASRANHEVGDDLLLSPGQLAVYDDWAASTPMSLSATEERFLAESRARRDAAVRRRSRSRRMVFAAISLVAVVAVAFALIAASTSHRARVLAADALVGDAQFRLSIGETEEAALALVESFGLDETTGPYVAMGEIVNGHQDWGRSMSDFGATAVKVAVAWERGLAATAGTPAGSGAATASPVVPIIDVATGDDVGRVVTTAPVNAVAFLSDGRLLTGDDAGMLAAWDVATGELASAEYELGAAISDIAVTADDVVVVSTFGDPPRRSSRVEAIMPTMSGDWSRISTFDVDALSTEGESLQGRVSIVRVLIGPDGESVVTLGIPLFAAGWDLRSGESTGLHLMSRVDSRAAVWGGTFSHDGRFLVTGHQNRTINLRDAGTLEPIGEPVATPSGQLRSLSFTPQDRELVTSGQDGVLIWGFSEETGFSNNPRAIGSTSELTTHGHALSPDGTRLVVAVSDRVRGLSLSRGRVTQPPEVSGVFWAVAVEGPETWFAGQGLDVVHRWNRQTGETTSFSVDTSHVPALAVAPGGGVLFTTHEGAVGRIEEGGPVTELSHADRVWGVAISPSRHVVATVSADNRIAVRDPATLEPIIPPFGPDTDGGPAGLKAVAFLDDVTLATAGGDGHLRIWNVRSTRQVLDMPIIRNQLNAIAVLPDGHVAVGDERGQISIVDLDAQAVVATLRKHTAAVRALAVSPDGTTLASGGQDNTLRLWDLETGAQVGLFRQAGAVRAVSFADDGATVIGADIDGEVVVWDADWPTWPDRLCQWLAGWDTARSWPLVMGDQPYEPTCGE